MNKIKKLVIAIFGLMSLGVGWHHLATYEENLVVLKCAYEIEENNEKKNLIAFYKITKHLLEEHPYKMYISNPDYDEKNYPPYLIGISVQSAKEADKEKLKSRPYLPPDWYTFIPEQKYGKFILPMAKYVNRVTLQMEDLSLEKGEQWGKSSCSIAQTSEFDNDYRSKLESKKKEQKF
jgi:hypothetical protein